MSQSPSHRGTLSDKHITLTPYTRPSKTQSPSHRGTLSDQGEPPDASETQWRGSIPFASGNRAGDSHIDVQETPLYDTSQSPSCRGNSQNLTNGASAPLGYDIGEASQLGPPC